MPKIFNPSIRYYARSRRKKDFNRPIALQVVCTYDKKRIAVSNIFIPQLTAKEFALFTSDAELKSPLPETDLTEKQIDEATERIRANKAFWYAAIDYLFNDEFCATTPGLQWQNMNLRDWEDFVWSNKSDIDKYARILRKSGVLK